MSEESSNPMAGLSSAGLLLRVYRTDGQLFELYVADGLTIGRGAGNTVELKEEGDVERSHSMVQVRDGIACLKCVGPNSRILLGITPVSELTLFEGAKFSIGRTGFECVPGLRQPFQGATPSQTRCPYCRSVLAADSDRDLECPACQRALIALSVAGQRRDRLLVPRKFGDYLVEAFVAEGGMGWILKGRSCFNKDPVAIKVLKSDKRVGKQAADRFKQEIVLMRSIRRPNVVKLLSSGNEGRLPYLVMQWIEGMSLREVIGDFTKRRRLVPFERALGWLEQVCHGLAALHSAGIIHRDIKPSNILIDRGSKAWLSDLGIAKQVEEMKTAITATGETPGTTEYMAPEQFGSPDTVDERTDFYSLGVTTYELLTGHRPSGKWQNASACNPTVPAEFDAILDKLIAQKPEDRFSNIHELLASFFEFRMTTAHSDSPLNDVCTLIKKLIRRGRLANVGLAALCAGVAAALVALGAGRTGYMIVCTLLAAGGWILAAKSERAPHVNTTAGRWAAKLTTHFWQLKAMCGYVASARTLAEFNERAATAWRSRGDFLTEPGARTPAGSYDRPHNAVDLESPAGDAEHVLDREKL